MRIGVLGVQGAFAEHLAMLDSLGVESRLVRLPHELEGLSGLILPGGESTAMRKPHRPLGAARPDPRPRRDRRARSSERARG